MRTKTRLQVFASFSRCASVITVTFLLSVSAMAFDDKGVKGIETSDSCTAAKGSISLDQKSETEAATVQPSNASGLFTGSNLSVPKDEVKDDAAKSTAGGPVQTSPFTSRDKFKYFLTRSFLRPTAYATAIASGAFGEWIDDDHHHHSKPGDFAADSMTRAARSFAFGTTANFFEKFAYASIFKQDPRYYKSDKHGAGARVGYAVSQLFVTRSDQGARQFNVSFIAGGLTAAAVSNAWERDERRDVSETLKRFGLHLGFTAASNIIREFFGKK